MPIYVDTETYSDTDIKTTGAFKYSENCELILAYFFDPLTGNSWCYDYSESDFTPPEWLTHALFVEKQELRAYNAIFDWLVLLPHLKVPLEQVVDVMAKVKAHGLPGALDKAGEALNIAEDKRKLRRGKALVSLFCTPHTPTRTRDYTRVTPSMDPEAWREFKDEYLVNDVHALVEIDNLLPDLSPEEHQVWVETQAINLRGVPIDLPMSTLINEKIIEFVDKSSTDFIRVTGMFPTQRDKVLRWCSQNGYPLPNLQAPTIAEALADKRCPEIVREALTARANTAHAAFKKYPVYINATCADGTIKGTLNYHSASTGRFGGRLIQTQNLAKGSIDAEEAIDRIKAGEVSADLFKSAVRGMIYHPEGLTIADFSSIEARGVLWLSGDRDGLQVYRDGLDPYKWMAQRIYEVPYNLVTDKQRFTGKQAVLGLGYQMGAPKFIKMVESYGETITPEEAKKAVHIYRTTHKPVVALWRNMEEGARAAMLRPGRNIKITKNVWFEYDPTTIFLYMRLPSGRKIAYPYPSLDNGKLSFMGLNSQNQWVREHTYGGKLTENAVQGLCRDILVRAVSRCLQQQMWVVTHIHDEIVVAGNHVDQLTAIMEVGPAWANGFPLEAKAHHVNRFKKV